MLQKYQTYKNFHTELSYIKKHFIPESQYIKYDFPDSCIPSENKPNPRYL